MILPNRHFRISRNVLLDSYHFAQVSFNRPRDVSNSFFNLMDLQIGFRKLMLLMNEVLGKEELQLGRRRFWNPGFLLGHGAMFYHLEMIKFESGFYSART